MSHLEIGVVVPGGSLMTPLAGLARNRRPEAAHSQAVVPASTQVPVRGSGLSIVWRTGRDGALIMEWKLSIDISTESATVRRDTSDTKSTESDISTMPAAA